MALILCLIVAIAYRIGAWDVKIEVSHQLK